MIPDIIGIKVRAGGQTGEVVRYEPLGSGMTDMLIRFDSGRECWHASHDVRRVDGAPLPDRSAVRHAADEAALASLRRIRAAHVRDWRQPWPGCEHGKAIVGQAIDGATADVSKRLAD